MILNKIIPLHRPSPNPLTTVELFCGIGGFRVAAESIGLKTVWANDIKPEACLIYCDRFGSDVLHEGDIKSMIESIPQHDILTAGFPCQPFSAAGKKEGTRDHRGTLFQSIVDVIKRKSPQYFVLENVKRLLSMEHGAHFATVLSALSKLNYFIEWRILNAKNFGLAQNRERVIIFGTRLDIQHFSVPDIINSLRLANMNDLLSAQRDPMSFLSSPTLWKPLEKHAAKFPNWGIALEGSAHETEKIGR